MNKPDVHVRNANEMRTIITKQTPDGRLFFDNR